MLCVYSVCEITDNPITYMLQKDDIEKTLTPFDVAVKLLTNLYGKFFPIVAAIYGEALQCPMSE